MLKKIMTLVCVTLMLLIIGAVFVSCGGSKYKLKEVTTILETRHKNLPDGVSQIKNGLRFVSFEHSKYDTLKITSEKTNFLSKKRSITISASGHSKDSTFLRILMGDSKHDSCKTALYFPFPSSSVSVKREYFSRERDAIFRGPSPEEHAFYLMALNLVRQLGKISKTNLTEE